MQENTSPKFNMKTFNRVRSSQDCETICRKRSDCAFFEWRRIAGRNDRCTIYEHIFLALGRMNSISGMKRCSKVQKLFEKSTCTLRNKKPVLKYVTTWRNLPSAQECKLRCDGEKKCQSWEWQKLRSSSRTGNCHAYRMDFRISANSISGPVKCQAF